MTIVLRHEFSLGMVVYTFSPKALETEAGKPLWFQSRSGLQEFNESQHS